MNLVGETKYHTKSVSANNVFLFQLKNNAARGDVRAVERRAPPSVTWRDVWDWVMYTECQCVDTSCSLILLVNNVNYELMSCETKLYVHYNTNWAAFCEPAHCNTCSGISLLFNDIHVGF